MRRGFPVVISAPSGAGKSTICMRLVRRMDGVRYSVSCTTRPPRKAERHGRDYFFFEVEDFKRRIHKGEFLEWAIVHDNYYGTPKAFVEERVAAGDAVLLALDTQGAAALRRKRPDAVLVFVLPPSFRSLEARLSRRKADAPDAVHRRLARAPEELAQAASYDYLVVNDDLDEAVRQVEAVITAERVRASRQDLAALGLAAAGTASGHGEARRYGT